MCDPLVVLVVLLKALAIILAMLAAVTFLAIIDMGHGVGHLGRGIGHNPPPKSPPPRPVSGVKEP